LSNTDFIKSINQDFQDNFQNFISKKIKNDDSKMTQLPSFEPCEIPNLTLKQNETILTLITIYNSSFCSLIFILLSNHHLGTSICSSNQNQLKPFKINKYFSFNH